MWRCLVQSRGAVVRSVPRCLCSCLRAGVSWFMHSPPLFAFVPRDICACRLVSFPHVHLTTRSCSMTTATSFSRACCAHFVCVLSFILPILRSRMYGFSRWRRQCFVDAAPRWHVDTRAARHVETSGSVTATRGSCTQRCLCAYLCLCLRLSCRDALSSLLVSIWFVLASSESRPLRLCFRL